MASIVRTYHVMMRRKISRLRRVLFRRFLFFSKFGTRVLRTIRRQSIVLRALRYTFLSVALVILVFGIYLWFIVHPLPGGPTQDVMIPYASSARGIANQLEAKGIIRSASGFLWYLRLFKRKADLRAGVYQLKPGMGIDELIQQLQKGSPLIYRITIPEGYNIREVANLLADKRLVNAERFLQVAQDPDFLSRYVNDFGTVHSAEGFLFPDTYDFAQGSTEEEILAVFLRRFKSVWNQELPKKKGDRNLYDVLTMASIVEREAKVDEERPIIAGVFYNRLKRGIPLESCATVQYALGQHKSRLLYKDLQVDSAYNTYRKRGLPPGPICSPGRDALRAALAPADHSYLYFVAKPGGDHHFSTSYREHLNAQRRIRQGKKP